jgi:hypothetical protein
MSSLRLPAYELLFIVDHLPGFQMVSHFKKIRLIQSVQQSIRCVMQRRIDCSGVNDVTVVDNGHDDASGRRANQCVIV